MNQQNNNNEDFFFYLNNKKIYYLDEWLFGKNACSGFDREIRDYVSLKAHASFFFLNML